MDTRIPISTAASYSGVRSGQLPILMRRIRRRTPELPGRARRRALGENNRDATETQL